MDMVDENHLQGHASVFNQLAPICGEYEEIAPTAFDQVLQRGEDIRFLYNHDPDNLLGRTQSGTLQVSVDDTGLAIDCELPDTTLGRDLRVLVKRRDLTGFSFGFMPDEGTDTYGRAKDGKRIRRRNNFLRVVDTSIVTFPAYDGANDAILRSESGMLMFRHDKVVSSNRSRLILARAASRHKKGKL